MSNRYGEQICAQYGSSNRVQARFCARCGHLPTATPPQKKVVVSLARPIFAHRNIFAVTLGVILLAAGLFLTVQRQESLLMPKPADRPSLQTEVVSHISTAEATVRNAPTLVVRKADQPLEDARTRAAESVSTPTPLPIPDEVTEESPLTIPGTAINLPRLTEEQEIAVGKQMHTEMLAEFRVLAAPQQLDRIQTIADRLTPCTDRPHLACTWTLLDDPMLNAFAIPGGFVYITREMLEFMGNDDDQMAFVMAHELAHIGRKHGAKRIEAIAATEIVLQLLGERSEKVAKIQEAASAQIAASATAAILLNGWSRQQEFEADEAGILTVTAAGYDPHAGIRLIQRLATTFPAENGGAADRLLHTHPPFDERIDRMEQMIGATE